MSREVIIRISDREYKDYYANDPSTKEVIRCNQCIHYQGVHGVPGHAPCDYWKSSGVMYDWYCSSGERSG